MAESPAPAQPAVSAPAKPAAAIRPQAGSGFAGKSSVTKPALRRGA